MRTPIEALKEIRDRLTYFCLRTDGKYDPPWATELVGIIDDAVTACHAVGNAAWKRESKLKPLTIAEWTDHEESIADIAAVLRRYVLPSLADRLMAAWKREKAEAEAAALSAGGIVEAARHQPVGNAAAMREALESVDSLIAEGIETEVDKELEHPFHLEFAREQIAAALSAPPRNCDVGTAYEQGNRMRQFCAKQKMDGIINCGYCPIKHQYQRDCTLAWAQMPYEAQEGGAAQ